MDRVNTLVARSQGNLKKNIYEPKMKILASVTGKPRGKYKTRERHDEGSKIISSVLETVEYERDSYMMLTNGTLIPEDMLGDYEWFVGRKAPKDWLNRMKKSAPESMTAINAAAEEFAAW